MTTTKLVSKAKAAEAKAKAEEKEKEKEKAKAAEEKEKVKAKVVEEKPKEKKASSSEPKSKIPVKTPKNAESGEAKAKRRVAEISSQYTGVNYQAKSKKWRAQIWYDGRNRSVGNFSDEVEAARAYDQKAIEYRGEGTKLNFKEESLAKWRTTQREKAVPPFLEDCTAAQIMFFKQAKDAFINANKQLKDLEKKRKKTDTDDDGGDKSKKKKTKAAATSSSAAASTTSALFPPQPFSTYPNLTQLATLHYLNLQAAAQDKAALAPATLRKFKLDDARKKSGWKQSGPFVGRMIRPTKQTLAFREINPDPLNALVVGYLEKSKTYLVVYGNGKLEEVKDLAALLLPSAETKPAAATAATAAATAADPKKVAPAASSSKKPAAASSKVKPAKTKAMLV